MMDVIQKKIQQFLLLFHYYCYYFLPSVVVVSTALLLFHTTTITTTSSSTTTATSSSASSTSSTTTTTFIHHHHPHHHHSRQHRLQHSSRQRIHDGWQACSSNCFFHRRSRNNNTNTTNNNNNSNNWIAAASEASEIIESEEEQCCWNISSSLPTTAFISLLEQHPTNTNSSSNSNNNNNNIHYPDINIINNNNNNNIYYSNNLGKLLPDISIVGREYYTLIYQLNLIKKKIVVKTKVQQQLPSSSSLSSSSSSSPPTSSSSSSFRSQSKSQQSRHIIRFHGINYRANAYWNGIHPIQEIISLSLNNNGNDNNNNTNTDILNDDYDHQQHSSNNNNNNNNNNDDHYSSLYSSLDGMFRRRYYDITKYIITSNSTNNNNNNNNMMLFQIRIEPPIHPGIPKKNNQGGDHSLAKDGPTSQYMLGWDWSQPMPDRSTGFFGPIIYHQTSGPYAIIDPAIQTIDIISTNDDDDDDDCSSSTKDVFNKICNNTVVVLIIIIQAHIECDGPDSDIYCGHNNNNNNNNITLRVSSDWGEIWYINSWNVTGIGTDIQSQPIIVEQPEKVRLWWPHGLAGNDDDNNIAHLHSFQFEVLFHSDDGMNDDDNVHEDDEDSSDDDTGMIVSDSIVIDVGIRTITTYLDETIQGQVFKINNKKIYLVGGNWIGTDQAMRYSASKERYCNELQLFKYAGLNLVRVWGGGITETTDFYECADKLGILVYQEFWMTGDNNGRWAGNYSWPYNYDTYLVNVQDVVRRLRRHPSLLFYGGCNECLAPRNQSNPPKIIDNGIRDIIKKYDHPSRFYISSSMGGPNIADTTIDDPTLWFNRSYSLSFADGPYGMLLPDEFFVRNPGLPFKNVSIGIQPEIGSSSSPTYAGLLRFMTKVEAERGFPRRNESGQVDDDDDDDNDIWAYHKYSSWKSNNRTYDHVYAYLDSSSSSFNDSSSFANASEWCAASQLAAHKQYQHMFEGYISHIYDYTSGVILWKAQSPWPALRGFLYDWYLESTGTLYGIRAALQQPISVAVDLSTWKLRFINRSSNNVTSKRRHPITINFDWIAINGTTVEHGNIPVLSRQPGNDDGDVVVPSMSSFLVVGNGTTGTLSWPRSCKNEVCFLHLTTASSGLSRISTWYWLPDPTIKIGNEFAALGRMRSRQNGLASIQIDDCTLTPNNGLKIDVTIMVSLDSPDPLFYPTFALHYSTTTNKNLIDGNEDNNRREFQHHQPILPIFDTSINEILILQGETQFRELTSPANTIIDDHFDDHKSGDTTTIHVRMDSWNGRVIEETISCSQPSAFVEPKL